MGRPVRAVVVQHDARLYPRRVERAQIPREDQELAAAACGASNWWDRSRRPPGPPERPGDTTHASCTPWRRASWARPSTGRRLQAGCDSCWPTPSLRRRNMDNRQRRSSMSGRPPQSVRSESPTELSVVVDTYGGVTSPQAAVQKSVGKPCLVRSLLARFTPTGMVVPACPVQCDARSLHAGPPSRS